MMVFEKGKKVSVVLKNLFSNSYFFTPNRDEGMKMRILMSSLPTSHISFLFNYGITLLYNEINLFLVIIESF